MKRDNRHVEEKKEETLLYLSQELIIQILLRLTVKSIIRFKCVCKSWLTLISSSHFTNLHFQLSTTTSTRRILLMSTSPPRQSRSIDFEASSLDGDSASALPNLNFMPFESYCHILIKGSCRGFLLLHCCSERTLPMFDIYLWNPSTGFHKKIPSSPFASNLDEVDECFYGFGYDHSTNDYLLVTMSSQIKYNSPRPQLEFYSLRANMWKEEGTLFRYDNLVDDEQPKAGFLFNGAIHWIAYSCDLREFVIIAFDLMERKLFNIHLRDDFDLNSEVCLRVFGEFVSLWIEHYRDDNSDYNHRLEIWVMKEYKVDSLWTKILVHSFYDISRKCYSPICSTRSGDIIGTYGFTLAKCDDKGQLQEYHSYFNDRRGGCEVALYVESLLSLPDNEQA